MLLGCNRVLVNQVPKVPGRFLVRFSALDGPKLFQLISTYRSSGSIDTSWVSNIISLGCYLSQFELYSRLAELANEFSL